MWDIVSAGAKEKHLIHRCFVDSDDPKDHGCAAQAHSYATGCTGFIEQYMSGELHDAYPTEEDFLENLGMFLGIVSHHIADMCTPESESTSTRLGSQSSSYLARLGAFCLRALPAGRVSNLQI